MVLQFLSGIALTAFLGYNLVFWLGILSGIFFFTTLSFGYLTYKGKIEFKWHKRVAFTTAIIVAIHILLALSLYF